MYSLKIKSIYKGAKIMLYQIFLSIIFIAHSTHAAHTPENSIAMDTPQKSLVSDHSAFNHDSSHPPISYTSTQTTTKTAPIRLAGRRLRSPEDENLTSLQPLSDSRSQCSRSDGIDRNSPGSTELQIQEALFREVEEERKRKYDQEKTHPGYLGVRALDNLTTDTVARIARTRWQIVGGLELFDIFPKNYKHLSIDEVKDYLERFYNFIVLEDPVTKDIFAVLIYKQLEESDPYVSIQLYLQDSKKLCSYGAYDMLHKKLEEKCKETGCKKISVIPTCDTGYTYYSQNGYTYNRKEMCFTKKVS
jgi:hypothetical protein